MNTSEFVVPLADLEKGPKRGQWPIPRRWLERALEGAGATPGDGEHPGLLDVELSKRGPEVMVRGQVRASVTMPCVRTLEPVPIEIEGDVFLLLEPARTGQAAGQRSRRAERAHRSDKAHPAQKTGGTKTGGGWAEDPTLTETDAAKDTYSGESVVLDPFIREFILLELPMTPMQKELPSDEPDAIGPSSPEVPAERPVDPRLLPLAEIASRLRNKE